MSRKKAVKKAQDVAELKQKVSILLTRVSVLGGAYDVLREENETIERVLEVMQENSGFKRDIINSHAVRINSLEENPVIRLVNRLFGWLRLSPKKKVTADG